MTVPIGGINVTSFSCSSFSDALLLSLFSWRKSRPIFEIIFAIIPSLHLHVRFTHFDHILYVAFNETSSIYNIIDDIDSGKVI